MSIEKLSDCSRTELEENPFTQICNDVILNIKDNDAFRVYAYLQSKSREWKVIREDVKRQCGIGDRKLEKVFSYLKKSNLIQYIIRKDPSGKFSKIDILVLNGLKFNQSINFLNDTAQSQPIKEDMPLTAPPLSAGAENRRCGNAGLLNKEITKEINIQNKDKNLPSLFSDEPVSEDSFDQFWEVYPVKKEKVDCRKLWKKDKLDKIVTVIVQDVNKRILNDPLWKKGFIKNPLRYLRNKEWTEKIEENLRKEQKKFDSGDYLREKLRKEGINLW